MLGAFEELVLLALVRLKDEAYAVPIRQDLTKRTGTEVAMGAVYATLDRLEDKGMVRPQESVPEKGRLGRPRRYLEICPLGIDALARTHSVRRRMWQGIDLADLKAESDPA